MDRRAGGGVNNSHRFDGETFDQEADGARLSTQLESVRSLMLDGSWRTLKAISTHVGSPESSVSARLCDLRKKRFGGYFVNRRRVSDGAGTHEYQIAA